MPARNVKPPYQAARQYASHMSSSKKAETVTWWIVTANGADIAKIIAYRGLYTTGQKLTHRIHPAGVGVPLIFGMPKECTGTTDEFVAHMNESRRDYGKQMFGAGVQITASHIQVYTESTLISMCNDLQLGVKKRKAADADAGAASDAPRDPATDLGLIMALEEKNTDHTADPRLRDGGHENTEVNRMRTVDLASFDEMLRTAEADELVKATEEAVQVDLLYRISNETFAIEVKEEEPEPGSEQSGSEDRTPIQKIPEPSSEFRGVCAHPKLGAVART